MTEKQSTVKTRKGGKREGAGRRPGVPNKLSGTVKDNIVRVFEKIGGVPRMCSWAEKNETQFYSLYAKLLPLQVTGEGGEPIQIVNRIELIALK